MPSSHRRAHGVPCSGQRIAALHGTQAATGLRSPSAAAHACAKRGRCGSHAQCRRGHPDASGCGLHTEGEGQVLRGLRGQHGAGKESGFRVMHDYVEAPVTGGGARTQRGPCVGNTGGSGQATHPPSPRAGPSRCALHAPTSGHQPRCAPAARRCSQRRPGRRRWPSRTREQCHLHRHRHRQRAASCGGKPYTRGTGRHGRVHPQSTRHPATCLLALPWVAARLQHAPVHLQGAAREAAATGPAQGCGTPKKAPPPPPKSSPTPAVAHRTIPAAGMASPGSQAARTAAGTSGAPPPSIQRVQLGAFAPPCTHTAEHCPPWLACPLCARTHTRTHSHTRGITHRNPNAVHQARLLCDGHGQEGLQPPPPPPRCGCWSQRLVFHGHHRGRRFGHIPTSAPLSCGHVDGGRVRRV